MTLSRAKAGRRASGFGEINSRLLVGKRSHHIKGKVGGLLLPNSTSQGPKGENLEVLQSYGRKSRVCGWTFLRS